MRKSSTPSTSRQIKAQTVMVFGTFDWLHAGHLSLFEQAKEYGGRLIIIVARDTTVIRIKGRAPDQNESERVHAIRQAEPRAQVELGSDTDFLKPIRRFGPDILLLGYDQRLPPGIVEQDLVGVVVRARAHDPKRYKSSLMRKNLKNQQGR